MSEETGSFTAEKIDEILPFLEEVEKKYPKMKIARIVVRCFLEEAERPITEAKEGEIVVNFEMADDTQAFGLETLCLTAKEGKHKLSSIVDYDNMVRMIVTELGSKYGSPVEVKAKDHSTAMEIEQLLSWVSVGVATIVEVRKYETRVEVKYIRGRYTPPPKPEPEKMKKTSKGWRFLRPGG